MGSIVEPRERTRWVVWIVVALAATAGALLAPGSWPQGAGTLTVRAPGGVVRMPVTVGDSAPVAADAGPIEVTVPAGVPVRGEVVVEVAGARLDAVEVTLRLPDGTTEPIPGIRTAADGTVVASRRAPAGVPATLGLLGAVVVLWVTEAIPLAITSLAIPVVLVAADVRPPVDALAPFFHPVIALFLGGFLMAVAMQRAGLDTVVANAIVRRAGADPRRLFAALLGTAALLSMFMSNTAAVAVLLPVAMAVTAGAGDGPYRRTVVLGIAYAATIGGVGSAIGTPANPLAIAFLDEVVGHEITFVGWFAFGLPMLVLFLPVIGIYLWWRDGVGRSAITATVPRPATRPTRDQVVVLAVFVTVAAVWMTQTWHGLDTGIVALAGAVVLAVLGRIEAGDLGSISWSSLVTFGGGLSLGFALTSTGTADWVATRLGGLTSWPAWLAVATVGVVTLVVTTFASNTAAAATFVPLAIPLAALLGVDPVLLVVVVAIASSIDFALVIGTPPTMLAYSTGLFTARGILVRGLPLDLVGIALLTLVVVRVWDWLGVV